MSWITHRSQAAAKVIHGLRAEGVRYTSGSAPGGRKPQEIEG